MPNSTRHIFRFNLSKRSLPRRTRNSHRWKPSCPTKSLKSKHLNHLSTPSLPHSMLNWFRTRPKLPSFKTKSPNSRHNYKSLADSASQEGQSPSESFLTSATHSQLSELEPKTFH